MKRHGALFFIYFALYASYSYASSGPPEPFYSPPSYIDPDYKSPQYTEVSYGPRTKFSLLLNDYLPTQQDEGNKDQDGARAASEKQEPENYARYLSGAEQFHAQHYDEALKIFMELRDLPPPLKQKLLTLLGKSHYSWVKEASSYMVARCQLIIAQKDWDGYSDPVTGGPTYVGGTASPVDQTMLKQSDASYQLYLQEYPQGLYARSARNIKRKILLLSGNREGLDQELKRAMLEAFPSSPAPLPHRYPDEDIVTEFENNFHGEIDVTQDSPILVAYAWVGNQKPSDGDIKKLEAREKDFSVYPGLFPYVRALGLYELGQYQELLARTPEAEVVKNTLSLSTQLLRARALLHLNKTEDALAAMEKIHTASPEDAIELDIAYLKVNNKDGLWLYTGQSPLTTEKNLRNIAQFALMDAELEKGITLKDVPDIKRQILLEELARRYMLSKRFKALAALFDHEANMGIFTPMKPTVEALADNPDDAKALLQIGGFLYRKYVTPDSAFGGYRYYAVTGLDELLPGCNPCKDFAERSKTYLPPITFFQSSIAIAQKSRQKSEIEAEDLYYLVKCFRGPEYIERCTWNRKFENTSEESFRRLYTVYKNSLWTKQTPYYY